MHTFVCIRLFSSNAEGHRDLCRVTSCLSVPDLFNHVIVIFYESVLVIGVIAYASNGCLTPAPR